MLTFKLDFCKITQRHKNKLIYFYVQIKLQISLKTLNIIPTTRRIKNIVIELCCSTSGGSGISSAGATVVVGGCVVVTGAGVVLFINPGFVVLFVLNIDKNS